MKIAALLMSTGALAAGSLHATLAAATHTPKVGVHWKYTVHATTAGRPATAKLTAQIIDPIGGKHPVGFGTKKGNVTNVPFTGTFSNYVTWPASAIGFPLTFRVTVVAGATKQIVNYKVTVHK